MTQSEDKISAIPTNIITGFLGVGKTSAILQLLKSKPVDERWAVLVNEFGEIGVDGSLFEGSHNEDQQVYIREVPGGCMCCAAGLPMQIALNQLLTRAKPHRLLIEPTGLGHPVEVLEVLTAEHYRDVLSIQKTLTLVDARKLDDPRYTTHETFNQQIAIADVIVGNKEDLYEQEHQTKLKQYAAEKAPAEAIVVFTQQGNIPAELLKGPTAACGHTHHHHHHHADENKGEGTELIADMPIPECGFIKAVNSGEGFHSIGWRFDPTKIFNRAKLYAFLNGVIAERMKAVFITNDGIYGYNLTSDALTEVALGDCMESKIEIIASDIAEQWEEQLFACIEEIS